MPFQLDPEVGAAIGKLTEGADMSNPPPRGEIQARRDLMAALIGKVTAAVPDLEDVTTQDHHTPAPDGHSILLRWITKNDARTGGKGGPAVLYIHGGGLIASSVDQYTPAIKMAVAASGVPTLTVDYRLCPEHKDPVGDCFAGLQYLFAHAADLGVDPTRVAVAGDSAGGCLAAGTALLARDRPHDIAGHRLAMQILVYPMLDDRVTAAPPDKEILPFLLWSYEDNATGWGALLGEELGAPGVDHYRVPGRLEDATGLPRTFIQVGELDLFRDEDVAFASKCWKAGVSTELHVYPGANHGFDAFGAPSDVATRGVQDRLKAYLSL